MPRISADTVAEHVAHQEAAVLDAAVRLFIERGYADVNLADIAAEVGLARSSLYRYVPDKLHLLVSWYRRTVPETIAAWEAAVAGEDPAADRLTRWAHTYLAWAASPEHQLVAPLTEGLGQLDDDTRSEVAVLHRSMMAVVAGVVADAGVADAQVPGTVEMLSGLVLGAARAEAAIGHSDPVTRRRLDAAVAAIIAS